MISSFTGDVVHSESRPERIQAGLGFLALSFVPVSACGDDGRGDP